MSHLVLFIKPIISRYSAMLSVFKLVFTHAINVFLSPTTRQKEYLAYSVSPLLLHVFFLSSMFLVCLPLEPLGPCPLLLIPRKCILGLIQLQN